MTLATVIFLLSRGPSRPALDAGAAELELFAEKERIRDQDWPPLNRAAARVRARIPDREGDADRLLIVQKLAKAAGVRVPSVTFMAIRASEAGGCAFAGLLATVDGGLAEVRAFVGAVERSERLILVDGLTISRAAQGIEVRAEVRLHFLLRDPAVDLRPFEAALKE